MDLMIHLRAICGIPGIAISGFGNNGDIEKVCEVGISEHLVKPVKLENLQAAMERAIGAANRCELAESRVPRFTAPAFHLRTVDLKITDVAFGGKGVARDNGKAVFIPFTIDGERVSANIVREKSNSPRRRLSILSKPHRIGSNRRARTSVDAADAVIQHIDYEHQLALKFRQVRDVLRRIGKLADVPMRPIIPSPSSYHYRNRITVHAQDGVVGFFRRESHRLIDIEASPIARPEVNDALVDLRRRLEDGHYTLRAEPGSPRFLPGKRRCRGCLAQLDRAIHSIRSGIARRRLLRGRLFFEDVTRKV